MNTLRNLSDNDVQAATEPRDFGAVSGVASLDARRNRTAWEREIVATLCRFLQLPENWDSYGGKPLRHDTGMFALQVLSEVMTERTPVPSLVPVPSGGIQCEWHLNGMDIELYIAAPFDCELSVYDHATNGPQVTIPLKTDLSPVSEYLKKLTDFTRHQNVA